MGYYSDAALDYTADDAAADRRDGLTPPVAPIAPATIEHPVEWPAPAFNFGETVYLRENGDQAYYIAGMRFTEYGYGIEPAWYYRIARRYEVRGRISVSSDEHDYDADNLSRQPWCDFCGVAAATTTIRVRTGFDMETARAVDLGTCAACAADHEPF